MVAYYYHKSNTKDKIMELIPAGFTPKLFNKEDCQTLKNSTTFKADLKLNLKNNKNISEKQVLNPYFITGYTDGDGSFSISVKARKTAKFGYLIAPVYSIGANINPYNKMLLENIQEFFGGVGSISKCANMYIYEVSSLKNLSIIRKHFLNYPLETSKSIHFLLWCQIIDLLNKKEHYTYEGFKKILSIKSVFPKGLTINQIEAFPNIVPIIKPEFTPSEKPLNPHWITGFVQADGTFGLNYIKDERVRLGFNCQPQFSISQHKRDLTILKRILNDLGCGLLIPSSPKRDVHRISISSMNSLVNIVIPFFERYPLSGSKNLDFKDFSKGIQIIKNKAHLTSEGLAELKDLANAMNSNRKF